MALPSDPDARQFYRAAYLRLEDGRLMLEHLRRPNAAIYLAGYGVECILKALILTRMPMSERDDIERMFRGGQGHDFDLLKQTAEGLGIRFPHHQIRDFGLLTIWSVNLRYSPKLGSQQDALRFLKAAQRMVNWANERIWQWHRYVMAKPMNG